MAHSAGGLISTRQIPQWIFYLTNIPGEKITYSTDKINASSPARFDMWFRIPSVITPKERKRVLEATRSRLLNQARLEERIERESQLRHQEIGSRSQPKTLVEWVEADKSGLILDPSSVTREFRNQVTKIMREAKKGAVALLGDKTLPKAKVKPVVPPTPVVRPRARVYAAGDGKCARCNCQYDEYTSNCNACAVRHHRRRRAGLEYTEAPLPVGRPPDNEIGKYLKKQGYRFLAHVCPECNGTVRISPKAMRTICLKCGSVLHPLGDKSEPYLNNFERASREGLCSGCGCLVEEKTVGCSTCYQRHYQWATGRRSDPRPMTKIELPEPEISAVHEEVRAILPIVPETVVKRGGQWPIYFLP